MMPLTSSLSVSPQSFSLSLFSASSSSWRSRELISIYHHKIGISTGCRNFCNFNLKLFRLKASMGDEEFGGSPMTPLQPQSPTGLFLSELLWTNPTLFPSAVEHELKILSETREADDHLATASVEDMVLYRRMMELKCQERFSCLEEIIYILIIRNFLQAGVAMIPSIRNLRNQNKAWPAQIMELECIHSHEVLELVREHLLLVLGRRGTTKYFNHNIFSHMTKMPMHEIYSTSAKYGYFLRRIYNRFLLEKTMKKSSEFSEEVIANTSADIASAEAVLRDLKGTNFCPNSFQLMTVEFLGYIMSFDVETLRTFSVVRSREGQSVFDKHCKALFEEPNKLTDTRIWSEQLSEVSFLRLKGLILEAVAFGSFLCDAETYVDRYYSLC